LPHSVDSKLSTPLCSNRAYVKTPAVIQPEIELSPLNCTCLKYSSVDCSLEGAQEISPVVVRSRVFAASAARGTRVGLSLSGVASVHTAMI
jgi:hypothetical protein